LRANSAAGTLCPNNMARGDGQHYSWMAMPQLYGIQSSLAAPGSTALASGRSIRADPMVGAWDRSHGSTGPNPPIPEPSSLARTFPVYEQIESTGRLHSD